MSGCFRSTGKETNNGKKNLYIGDLLYLKIRNLVIHCIPLSNNFITSYARGIGKYMQMTLHPALTFTLSHVAIQLNMENDDIIIIEYGQYLTEDSKENTGILCSGSSGSGSSNNARKDFNENLYYYINKDGLD